MELCIYCLKEMDAIVQERSETIELKGEKIVCNQKHAFCPDCGQELYAPELHDENLIALYDAYREKLGLISMQDVLTLSQTYDISKRNFSLLLGWGEHTFERFCQGYLPTPLYSDEMKALLSDPGRFAEKLERFKDKIPLGAYQKARDGLNKLKTDYLKFDPKWNLSIDISFTCEMENIVACAA